MASSSSISTQMSRTDIEVVPCSREEFVKFTARFIITDGLPLNFSENPRFVAFSAVMHPSYTKVDTKSLVLEAYKEFLELKKVLHSRFSSLSYKIALACDVWRDVDQWKSIRITAHWIDSNWSMERRVINFKLLDVSVLDAACIWSAVIESIEEWGINDKTLSVTFDDVCDFPGVTEDLKSVVNPILEGKVFRVGCASRVLSSCVQLGLKCVSSHISKIRKGIQLTYNICYSVSYRNVCEKYGLGRKLISCDFPNNWDSTRQMLRKSMAYKEVLNEFIASKWPNMKSWLISEEDWEIASVFCRFLDVFYDAVDYISTNYYPSSCGILGHLVNIAKLFSDYRENFNFKKKMSGMDVKFRKHFERIPVLYCLAAVMDPRTKLSGCECLMESFYRCTDNVSVDVQEEKIKVSNLLHEMYGIYESQSSERQEKKLKMDPSFNELTLYLQTPYEYPEHEIKDFDVLAWWKEHEEMYPVIATMARDLLTTPVSTLAPDCAFVVNPDNDILGEGYRLKGKILEMYTCLRDWYHVESRTQGKRKPYDDDDHHDGDGDDHDHDDDEGKDEDEEENKDEDEEDKDKEDKDEEEDKDEDEDEEYYGSEGGLLGVRKMMSMNASLGNF